MSPRVKAQQEATTLLQRKNPHPKNWSGNATRKKRKPAPKCQDTSEKGYMHVDEDVAHNVTWENLQVR